MFPAGTNSMCDLFIVTGEPSGDLHGAHLIEALEKTHPSELAIEGVFGPRMRDTTGRSPSSCAERMETLQSMGFVDVIASLPRLIRAFYRIRNEILRKQPKAVIFIDYPGFNLRLARSLRKKGFQGKLIHYICPSVWAWGKGRIPLMANSLDLLLCLLPFEPKCFADTKLPCRHVGHPLVKKISQYTSRIDFHRSCGLNPGRPILALFPGSRKNEIERNFPLQLKAALQLQTEVNGLQIAVSLAHEEHRGLLSNLAQTLPVVPPDYAYDLMQNAHLAFATSGTVSLELALFQTPAVINYAITPFDLFLAQKIFRISLPHYCLVNIIAQKRVYPELFGPHFHLDALVGEAKSLLLPQRRLECREGCAHVKHLLGSEGGCDLAAQEILCSIF